MDFRIFQQDMSNTFSNPSQTGVMPRYVYIAATSSLFSIIGIIM